MSAAAAAAPPPPAPALITQAQSGKTYRVVRGRELTLRLPGRWNWSQPRTGSVAVELTPVEYFVDPGYSEWRIATLRRGVATIRSVGTSRSSGGSATRRFFVTLRIVL